MVRRTDQPGVRRVALVDRCAALRVPIRVEVASSVARVVAGAVLLGLGASGCYRYAYHERNPVGSHDLIAIDRQEVESYTAWSYFWGLRQSEWAPDPLACDGNGAGRVEVGFRWFSVPLMLLTLGVVAPTEMVVFCSTDNAPGEGP
jgi:hypothetical protein